MNMAKRTEDVNTDGHRNYNTMKDSANSVYI